MTDFYQPLPAAIIAALSVDTGVQTLLGNPARVFDHRPAMATFPYVVVAQGESRDIGAKGLAVTSQLLTLQVFSRQRGGSEARQILAAVRAALQDASLVLSAGSLVRCQEETSSVRYDDKSESSSALVRYRIVVSD